MTQQFEGKVVVITGGGGGIGKAAARRFLDEGARVVLSGTRAAKLEAARDELDPTGDRVEVVAGAVLVAVVAIATEVAFGILQRALSPRTRSRGSQVLPVFRHAGQVGGPGGGI